MVGRLPAERRGAAPLRGHVLRTARSSSGTTDRSPRRSRSSSPRSTTPRFAAFPSRTRGAARGTSRSPRTPSSRCAARRRHGDPAFSKLFVQTEHLARGGAILATRRRRSPGEPEVWAAPLPSSRARRRRAELETDRARFLGRGCETRAPIAVMDGRPLSNTAGTVLDPVFALRRRVNPSGAGHSRLTSWRIVIQAKRHPLPMCPRRPACPAGGRREFQGDCADCTQCAPAYREHAGDGGCCSRLASSRYPFFESARFA